MKNKIEDLRNHLFVTIESLLDTDKPMEIGRAKAIAEVAQVMINSAKVEVDMVKALGAGNGTGFLQIEQEPPK
ncbi:hypothetical protein [Pseudomonas tolaasii]|jgi:hypothetical protein|uniref:hypothetical protein n=1 Tax=Pseudomonas tolaasii TaxID=29442 RepID=UPI0002E4736E|nr:hypothetical protein [Pseudomonas tolaasii]